MSGAVDLHYAGTGSDEAPAVLFGGSLGTTLEMWEPQLTALARSRRVIRFDHRGHGGSPVPEGPYTIDDLGGDVVALMDRLELERASYCGLSIGGMVGQWLGINAPERLQRLVLLCTSPHLPPAQTWRERAQTVREAGTPEVVADATMERWFTAEYRREHGDVVARHRQMIATTAAEGYASCCEAIAAMDLRPRLGEITTPTLVIAGAQDPATPPDHGKSIARAAPGARLEVLDPGAHLANVERADAVNRLILEHLEAG